MSRYNIRNNPELEKMLLNQYKTLENEMPDDSVFLEFKQELLNLGFKFEVLNQAESFMPEHKDIIFPIVAKYYKKAKTIDEKRYFSGWFHHRGLEEAVPILLEDYFSESKEVDRWAIGDHLYQICSKKYMDDYIKIAASKEYGSDRQMIVLLLGKLKDPKSIPILIELFEEENVRLHAIMALGQFKQNKFRPLFERFIHSHNTAWRKQSVAALKKLNNNK